MSTVTVEVLENDKLIYAGSYAEVGAFLGYSARSMQRYASEHIKVKNRFYLRRMVGGKEFVSRRDKRINDERGNIDEYYINYIVWHLSKFGNCAMKKSPAPYIDEVRKQGYEFTYREDYIIYTDACMTSRFKKKSKIYILEGHKI